LGRTSGRGSGTSVQLLSGLTVEVVEVVEEVQATIEGILSNGLSVGVSGIIGHAGNRTSLSTRTTVVNTSEIVVDVGVGDEDGLTIDDLSGTTSVETVVEVVVVVETIVVGNASTILTNNPTIRNAGTQITLLSGLGLRTRIV
jgi:hypothetical protein